MSHPMLNFSYTHSLLPAGHKSQQWSQELARLRSKPIWPDSSWLLLQFLLVHVTVYLTEPPEDRAECEPSNTDRKREKRVLEGDWKWDGERDHVGRAGYALQIEGPKETEEQ
ncbi:hypothetical protein P691DRAFT_836504 [Macrolepiota fuliginosa MF-IS2]|uniref:Uncharacterized protein n=1 Tax=Macrolepiota fuliginosa MF-IS2 TaxID=1400762 RepID=A0A9P5WVQ4_9AGAR|nr:hypothetical protein P691DRAFT_836504 [Macrolepiota fuliginosa MF-IS2]